MSAVGETASATPKPFPSEVVTPYSGPPPTLNHDPVVVQGGSVSLSNLSLSSVAQPPATNSDDAVGLALTVMVVSGLIAISSFGLFLKLR